MSDQPTELDAVVVGAGFAGMYMLHSLRERGYAVRAYDTAADVGGTWYWNRYPGARCDFEGWFYCYSFSEELQKEWRWTERYPAQPELLRYAQFVADRLDLRRDISFETGVVRAQFDEAANRWLVTLDDGSMVRSQFLITAVGCLSASRTPDISGVESFAGTTFHTARWPHEPVDFTGLRVGVIGTGSSGIQVIPQIAQQARRLTVFQRTAGYSIPAHNRSLADEDHHRIAGEYVELRRRANETPAGVTLRPHDHGILEVSDAERELQFERRWADGGFYFVNAFRDTGQSLETARMAGDFAARKIAEIVTDPTTATALTPTAFPFGAKRTCVDTDYYATYNRESVELVDLQANPIQRIEKTGLVAGETDYELDCIVFATGFDAMTGPLLRIDIVGVGGETLKDKWAAGPRTYLGLSVAGFPNLFMLTGPGSPSVLTNVIVAIEQHVEWVARCLDDVRRMGVERIEASLACEDAWVNHVNEVAAGTLYQHAASWYLGANVPGKPRVFMPYAGGLDEYGKRLAEVTAGKYQTFELTQLEGAV